MINDQSELVVLPAVHRADLQQLIVHDDVTAQPALSLLSGSGNLTLQPQLSDLEDQFSAGEFSPPLITTKQSLLELRERSTSTAFLELSLLKVGNRCAHMCDEVSQRERVCESERKLSC